MSAVRRFAIPIPEGGTRVDISIHIEQARRIGADQEKKFLLAN